MSQIYDVPSGTTVEAAIDNVNVYPIPGYSKKKIATFQQKESIGRYSGNTVNMKDTGIWLQINLFSPIAGKTYGYVRAIYKGIEQVIFYGGSSETTESATASDSQCIKLLSAINSQNKKVCAALFRCHILIKQKEQKHYFIPISYINTGKSVYSELLSMDEKIKDTDNIKYQTTSIIG